VTLNIAAAQRLDPAGDHGDLRPDRRSPQRVTVEGSLGGEASPIHGERIQIQRVVLDLISKTIIEAHGGRIRVEPAQPRGAAFKVQLPQQGD